jgi:hypothetical protein
MGNLKEVIRESEKKNGETVELFTIIGQVIGHSTGESTYGPWVKIKGRFRATNKITGDIFNSAVAMLPDEAMDPLLAVLAIDGASSVDMAFDINAKIDDATAVGYVYEVVPLMKPSEDDPLERLALTLAPPPAKGKAAK